MISLPNFAEFAESVNCDEELTAENYCDQTPVNMEFSFEEHDVLNNALIYYLDAFYSVGFDSFEFPDDSEVVNRYKLLESIKDRSFDAWKNRFGND